MPRSVLLQEQEEGLAWDLGHSKAELVKRVRGRWDYGGHKLN